MTDKLKPTGYIQGIDACSIQVAYGPIDYKKAAESGVQFVYWKSSQYSSTVDRTFDKNMEEAEKAGLATGAYHFCAQNKPGTTANEDTPERQMEFFYKSCGGMGSRDGELPPMLDWEFCSHTDYKWCVDWIRRAFRHATKLWYPDNDTRVLDGRAPRFPVIYTYPYYAQQHAKYLGPVQELAQGTLCFASYKAKWENGKSVLLPWDPEAEGLHYLHGIPRPWELSRGGVWTSEDTKGTDRSESERNLQQHGEENGSEGAEGGMGEAAEAGEGAAGPSDSGNRIGRKLSFGSGPWEAWEGYEGYTRSRFWLHQYSGNNGKKVPGVIPDCDRQVFYGTAGDFAEFRGLVRPVSSAGGPTTDSVCDRVNRDPNGGS